MKKWIGTTIIRDSNKVNIEEVILQPINSDDNMDDLDFPKEPEIKWAKPIMVTKEEIYALDPKDFATANKIISTFLRQSGERWFETLVREWSLLLLLKNNDQVDSIEKLLQPTGLNIKKDKLLKLSLTIDLIDFSKKRKLELVNDEDSEFDEIKEPTFEEIEAAKNFTSFE